MSKNFFAIQYRHLLVVGIVQLIWRLKGDELGISKRKGGFHFFQLIQQRFDFFGATTQIVIFRRGFPERFFDEKRGAVVLTEDMMSWSVIHIKTFIIEGRCRQHAEIHAFFIVLPQSSGYILSRDDSK